MKAVTAGGIFSSIFLLFFLVSIEKCFSYQWNLKQKNSCGVKGVALSDIHHSVGWITKRYFKVCGADWLLFSNLLGLSSTAAWTSSVLAGLSVRNCFKKKKTPLVQNNMLTPRGRPQKVTQRRVEIATRTNCTPNKTMNHGEEPPGFFASLLLLTCFQWSQWYLGQPRSYASPLTFMYTTPFDLTVHLEANDTH